MAHYSTKIREEELKNRVKEDWFADYDTARIVGNIDFYVGKGTQTYVWGEAKKGVKKDIYTSFVQLILTIGKAKTYSRAEQLPTYLCSFDAEKIGFVLYDSISEVFEQNDFNWNATPSNHNSKEFVQLYSMLHDQLADSIQVYDFDRQAESLRYFIRSSFVLGNHKIPKVAINKNNFPHVYRKWYSEVLGTLAVDWESLREIGIYEHDFFLADLISENGKTIPQKLSVLLKNNCYNVVVNQMRSSALFANFGFNDGQKAHRQFWQRYKRPPKEEYRDYIIERADRLKPQDIRESHGAFFTPPACAELAQLYIAKVLGENWQEEYYVWDCAAGTGNLLAGLINTRNLWASTLEKDDVDIMKERIQGRLNLFENHVFQFDFVNDPLLDQTGDDGKLRKSKVPDELQAIISNPEERKKLVIFINPPYGEGDNRRGEGRSGIADNTYVYREFGKDLGYTKRELYIQFLYRIYKQIRGAIIADFSKLKNLQAPKFNQFRAVFEASPKAMFIVPANVFDNVDNGEFPIGFKIWDTSVKQHFDQIVADVYEGKTLMPAGQKTVVCYDGRPLINDWAMTFREEGIQGTTIATVIGVGNDFQNQRTVRFERPKRPWNHQFQWQVYSDNLLATCVYVAVRLIPEANWLNDRDQFLAPSDDWASDELFQTDCLAYAIFSTKNNVRSADGTNHWQPFTEKQLGLTQALPSHFMTDFMAGKAKCFSIPPFSQFANKQLTFSDTAQAVFDAALPLWQYYHAQPEADLNASYYDIREYFCKRDNKGKLNSKSFDEKYNKIHDELRKAHRGLGRHIETKVYEYGFLKK